MTSAGLRACSGCAVHSTGGQGGCSRCSWGHAFANSPPLPCSPLHSAPSCCTTPGNLVPCNLPCTPMSGTPGIQATVKPSFLRHALCASMKSPPARPSVNSKGCGESSNDAKSE